MASTHACTHSFCHVARLDRAAFQGLLPSISALWDSGCFSLHCWESILCNLAAVSCRFPLSPIWTALRHREAAAMLNAVSPSKNSSREKQLLTRRAHGASPQLTEVRQGMEEIAARSPLQCFPYWTSYSSKTTVCTKMDVLIPTMDEWLQKLMELAEMAKLTVLIKEKNVLNHLHKKLRNISKKSEASKKKTAQTVLVVVVVFGVSWLPHHVVHLWAEFGDFPLTQASFFFRITAHCLAYSNSSVNPIIYAFLSENFRKAYKQVFECQIGHNSPLNEVKDNKSNIDTPPFTNSTHV